MSWLSPLISICADAFVYVSRFDHSLADDTANAGRGDFDEDDYDWSSQGYYHDDN